MAGSVLLAMAFFVCVTKYQKRLLGWLVLGFYAGGDS